MWIPYDVRATLKAESDGGGIAMARADTSQRDFLVGFFLRNPVSRLWEVDLLAAADLQLDDRYCPAMRISLHANEGGKLAEIICHLMSASAGQALESAHGAVERLLQRYIIETGRGMDIAGWRIADLKHGARWRSTPFRPSALELDFASLTPIEPDLAPFARLFQRARGASDATGRLMAAFAVLHAAVNNHPALARSGAGELHVTQEMLIHSSAIDAPEEMLGIGLAELVDVLRPHYDGLFTADGVLAAPMDGLPARKHRSQLANLADLVAHRLISTEMRARDMTNGLAREAVRESEA